MRSTSAILAAVIVATSAAGSAQAQTVGSDPLKQGRVLELSFGLFAPQNTLQDTLTTLNGGGALVQSTDILDFGNGGRYAIDYSQPWGGSRLVVSLMGTGATGNAGLVVGGSPEAFPGSYDDGYNLPAGWSVDTEVETKLALLSVGREWQLGSNWNVSAGLQAGQASQDFAAVLRNLGGFVSRQVRSDSSNRMFGVFGGASHYSALGSNMGLRLSATLGVMRNSFDYTFTNADALGIPNSTFDASSSSTAISTRVSARLERSLWENGVLSLEIGYEGLNGIGNGADTLLDPAGTTSSANIESDSIGGGYVALGYAFRF